VGAIQTPLLALPSGVCIPYVVGPLPHSAIHTGCRSQVYWSPWCAGTAGGRTRRGIYVPPGKNGDTSNVRS